MININHNGKKYIMFLSAKAADKQSFFSSTLRENY
jgi:hypothetical protein